MAQGPSTTWETGRRRPAGITILAILQFLLSLALLLGGLVLVAGSFFVTALVGLPGLVVLAIGVVLTIFGLIGLVIGWGLWTLQPWARVLALVFVILAFVVNLVSIVAGNFGGVVGIIIDLLLLWYLTRPGVKAAFAPAAAPRAPA